MVWKLNSIYVTLDHKTSLKGIVHPKKLNSVIIYSPSSCSKPVRISLFWLTRRKIFWRKFVTRLFWGTIDFHSRTKNTMEENDAPELLFPTFFRISSFVFSRTKIFIQVWNYMRVSKWWQNFHFWVNYPFKSLGYICSNSQKNIVWVKMIIIHFSFMPKIIRTLSKDNFPSMKFHEDK